jgi:hypothetical protein
MTAPERSGTHADQMLTYRMSHQTCGRPLGSVELVSAAGPGRRRRPDRVEAQVTRPCTLASAAPSFLGRTVMLMRAVSRARQPFRPRGRARRALKTDTAQAVVADRGHTNRLGHAQEALHAREHTAGRRSPGKKLRGSRPAPFPAQVATRPTVKEYDESHGARECAACTYRARSGPGGGAPTGGALSVPGQFAPLREDGAV